MRYQFTLFSDKGFAPVATIIEAESRLACSSPLMRNKAIVQICTKRGWQRKDIEKFGYNKFKIRVAPPERTKPTGINAEDFREDFEG